MFNFLKNKYLIVSIVLFFLLIIFFNEQIFNNETLIPLDILKEFDLMLKQENSISNNRLLSDIVDALYPNYNFIYQNINSGIIPFWNPHVFTGIPFFADSQVGFFEFTHLFSYIFKISPLAFPLFSGILSIFILGISFFIYLKNLKFNTMVALFGSVVLMFSGTIIVWINYPLISAFIWLPLALFCIDKITQTRNQKYFPALSLVVCFMLFAGYPQIALINLFIIILYYFFRSRQNKIFNIKLTSLVLIFLLIGIGISMIQIGPSWNLIKKSEAYEVGRDYTANDNIFEITKNQFTAPGHSLKDGIEKLKKFGVLAFSPDYYGSPVDRNFQHPNNDPYLNFSEITIYSGIFTVLLAILSIVFIKKEKITIFWIITAIISFSLATNLPFLGLFKYLPLVNKISISRFRVFFVFSIVLLAVYSLEKIFIYLKNKNYKLAKIFIVILITFSFFDLFQFFHNYNLGNKKDVSFITQNNAVIFLQENTPERERIIGLGKINGGLQTPLVPNISTVAGLYDVRGYNPIAGKNYLNFADKYLTRRGSFVMTDAIFDEKIIDLMSVKYIICPSDGCLVVKRNEEWIKEYEDKNIEIFKNPNFLPRTYIAYNHLLVSDNQSIKALESKNFNPYSQVIIEKKAIENLENKNEQPIKKAEIIEYSANKVVIKAQANRSGILVLTDNYDTGWKAEVNNKEENILRVNGIFRGVIIPEGESKIVFRYLPENFYIYMLITIFSLLILLTLSIIIQKKIIKIN